MYKRFRHRPVSGCFLLRQSARRWHCTILAPALLCQSTRHARVLVIPMICLQTSLSCMHTSSNRGTVTAPKVRRSLASQQPCIDTSDHCPQTTTTLQQCKTAFASRCLLSWVLFGAYELQCNRAITMMGYISHAAQTLGMY
jgi:hypothetical protein